MARPRRRQIYSPALLENLRFRFEQTDEPLVAIAASIARSHTHLSTVAREHGWTRFVPPPLDITPAAKLAAEAARLANLARRPETAARSAVLEGPPTHRSFEASAQGALAPQDDGGAAPATPEPSAPRAAPTAAGEAATPAPATDVDLSLLAPAARIAHMNELMRAAEFQLARLRQQQALSQGKKAAMTIAAAIANLMAGHSQIEHQLQDLERGQHARTSNDDDRRPDDIDERRRRLAERIREFVRSRRSGDDAAGLDGGEGR